MEKAILGTKIGMTQIFGEGGVCIPVTVVMAGPCVVTQKKTVENDGYDAVQVGFGDIREKLVNKPETGHFAKAGVAVIAKATNAAVLPAAIYCDGPIKFGKKVTIRYGKLITVEELGLNKEETAPSDIKNAANLVMDNILSLWEAEKNERN